MPYFTFSGEMDKTGFEELKNAVRNFLNDGSNDDPFYSEPLARSGKIEMYVTDSGMDGRGEDEVMNAVSTFLKETGRNVALVGEVQDCVEGLNTAYDEYFAVSANAVKYINPLAIATEEAKAMTKECASSAPSA